MDLFQRPPFRFDVIVVIGNIRRIHIAPIADAVGHGLPFARIFPDGLLALFDERLDAVIFNVLFVVEPESLFHFQLDGQAVGIPARLAQDVATLHGLVTGDDVLDDAGEDVPDVRLAVRRRGTVIKGKLLAPFALFHTLFKDAVFVPELHRFLFPSRKIHGRIHFFVHIAPPLIF